MAFHTADYAVYIVLGDPDAPPLWTWIVWQRFLPSINPLIELARGKPAVRSTQYLPNQADVVKFGRLGWKESDHQKWTHGSPLNEESSKSWNFLSVETWVPTWNVCERERQAPDLFLSISDERLVTGSREQLLFNPVVVFAVVSELAEREPSATSAVVSALRELMSAKVVGHQRRPWGKAFGSSGFTNCIQDLAVSGLFKPGPRHRGELGLHLLSERWEPVTSEGVADPGR